MFRHRLFIPWCRAIVSAGWAVVGYAQEWDWMLILASIITGWMLCRVNYTHIDIAIDNATDVLEDVLEQTREAEDVSKDTPDDDG